MIENPYQTVDSKVFHPSTQGVKVQVLFLTITLPKIDFQTSGSISRFERVN